MGYTLLQSALPVTTVWILDVPQEDLPSYLMLQLYQFLSVFPLLVRSVEKVLGKVHQSHMIPVKVARH